MIYRTTLFILTLFLMSCNGDPEVDCDVILCENYRFEFVGTYQCTKSHNSFDDDNFATDIEVVVELDPENPSLLIVNGMKVPISEDGTFGPDSYDSNHFDLRFSDNSIRMLTYPIVPGTAITCYIKGDKI